MLKKMMLLAMAVGALIAFAAPAAQATTVLNTEGEPAETITAFSGNLKSTTTAGTLDCNQVNITGDVENELPHATISNIHGTATSSVEPFASIGECPVRNAEGVPVSGARITSIGGHASLSGGTATVSFDFTYDVTVAAGVFLNGCTFEVNNAKVPYTTKGVITFANVALAGGSEDSELCSNEGIFEGELQLDGTVEG
jgi:hypothetical protein